MDTDLGGSVAQVSGQIEEMVRRANATAVFGEPIRQGEVTLIPVASVAYGFGSGQGWGSEEKSGEAAAGTKPPTGGAGGGGGAMAHPIGYIHIDQNGARWEPVMDMTRVSVGGMLLAGWVIFWVTKTLRALFRK